jgi:hypothetical protein
MSSVHPVRARMRSATPEKRAFWEVSWISAGKSASLKHVAEQSSLLDGVVERHVRMPHGIEPLRGHRLLAARSIWFAQQRHCVGFDINCRIAEWVLAPELGEIPIDERKIESGRVADKHRPSAKRLEPGNVALQGNGRRFEILPAGRPCLRLCGPTMRRSWDPGPMRAAFPSWRRTSPAALCRPDRLPIQCSAWNAFPRAVRRFL